MIQAHLSGEKITSNAQEAFSLNDKSFFGENSSGLIEYSPIEALYLISKNKMVLLSGKKEIPFINLLSKAKKNDKKIEVKLSVFSDLRKKGYILKSALKFGTEFRVYDLGTNPETSHARWLLQTFRESQDSKWYEFSAKCRIANSTKKTLLIAIVDEEGDVSYYECAWKRV